MRLHKSTPSRLFCATDGRSRRLKVSADRDGLRLAMWMILQIRPTSIEGMVHEYKADSLNRIGSTRAATIATSIRPREQAMPKKKTPARNPWTKEDLRQLKAHSKTRTPVVEVAKAMKRTKSAVRQKAKTIGVGLGHRR